MIIFVKFLLISFFVKLSEEVAFDLGVIPYYFDEDVYGKSVLEKTRAAFKEIESRSCLKFIQTTERNASDQLHPRGLLIINPENTRECVHNTPLTYSYSLMWAVVTLGYDCLEQRQILHSLLHGLGMKDEVTHPGRDQYVRVMWANIAPEYRRLYQLDAGYAPSHLEFDTQSVMQFHDRAFSVNGKATLEPLVSGLTIEPSEHLSQLDSLRLHLLFNKECSSRDVNDILETCRSSLTPSGRIENDEEQKDDPTKLKGYNKDDAKEESWNPENLIDLQMAKKPGEKSGYGDEEEDFIPQMPIDGHLYYVHKENGNGGDDGPLSQDGDEPNDLDSLIKPNIDEDGDGPGMQDGDRPNNVIDLHG